MMSFRRVLKWGAIGVAGVVFATGLLIAIVNDVRHQGFDKVITSCGRSHVTFEPRGPKWLHELYRDAGFSPPALLRQIDRAEWGIEGVFFDDWNMGLLVDLFNQVGGVSRLRIESPTQSSTALRPLLHLERLEHLELGTECADDAALGVVAQFKNLRSLHVSGSKVTIHGIDELITLPRLEHLRLEGRQIDDGVLPVLAAMPALSSVSLKETNVSESKLRELRRRASGFDYTLEQAAME